MSTYTQLRTNRGALRAWKFKIGKDDSPQCRHCGEGDETGDHLMFACKKWKKLRRKVWCEKEAISRRWRSWEGDSWLRKEEDKEGKLLGNDLVRDFMEKIRLLRLEGGLYLVSSLRFNVLYLEFSYA